MSENVGEKFEKIIEKGGFLTLSRVRDLLLICLILVVALRLLTADIKIDLSSFSFNDFLALTLALFSVALSVAFYFKADDASSKFYDNSYRFTKEISEMLGRIEAGFGERLRNLDEGYNGMLNRLDKLPSHSSAIASEAGLKEVQAKEEAQKDVLETLFEKAKLDKDEKEEMLSKLKKTSEELEVARRELLGLQQTQSLPGIYLDLFDQLADKIIKKYGSRMFEHGVKIPEVKRMFAQISPELTVQFLKELSNSGYLDDYGLLNTRGVGALVNRLNYFMGKTSN